MKDEILRLLKDNKDGFISGENISNELGVSRTAIWKVINTIKEEGYVIESVSRKGYRLLNTPDLLTENEILDNLNTNYIGRNIIHFDTIDSTNNKAKELASLGEVEGTTIISEEQTMGRGRLGRTWISPKYKGIWMSIILRPNISPQDASKITQIGAAAVLKAIRDLELEAFIKWPNDIVLNKKKVCGILTEMSAEIDKINYLVVGIGINVNIDEYEFPKELKNMATSLKSISHKKIDRKNLVSNILNNFEKLYDELICKNSIDDTIQICKDYSVLLGKEVKIIKNNEEIIAKAIDVNKDGNLVVKYESGETDNIISGEVSIRGLYGYV